MARSMPDSASHPAWSRRSSMPTSARRAERDLEQARADQADDEQGDQHGDRDQPSLARQDGFV